MPQPTSTPLAGRRSGDLGALLCRTSVLCALVLLVHIGGRVAAIHAPARVDSLLYSRDAWLFHSAGTEPAELVMDKPPGQPFLTGWVYRLLPAPPTRLALAPLETAFMVSAYVVLVVMLRRVCATATALGITLLGVLAIASYGALDITTDGFNVNESYLLLPVVSAAALHLYGRSRWAMIGRGVALGAALLIKQTAIAILLAILIDECFRWRHTRRLARAAAFSAIGGTLAAVPLVLYLVSRGWLGAYVDALLRHSGGHAAPGAGVSFILQNLAPLVPLLWLVAAGLLLAGDSSNRDVVEPPTQARPAARFALIWLLCEVLVVASMRKPATHYMEMIVPPLALVTGVCAGRVLAGRAVRHWLLATTAGLALWVSLPFLAEAPKRAVPIDWAREAAEFQIPQVGPGRE